MEFYKFDVTILKIFLGWKTAKKWPLYWIFGHLMAQKKKFQNRYIKSVELHTENLQMNFQVPSIYYISCPNECTFCDFSVSRFLTGGFEQSLRGHHYH